ncbi:putative lipopolysaccharide biosynthesis enzyme KdtB [Malacoplasma penetrans HF-2]|uniref:Phosphopantetheine adenylyltransferase n=1 Tax=Malacoplasma penetrans (strain HF-2) TaxID=272633 RepID=COAD_MALP2|nr:pantetheine-phosphate adenylyltransferase [Malacoplasma penetrans]Q8EUG2.1 RecName: Full=Phosphopantetheine adenylyltransferase; AltName: Full=Dephospho-CoA pyrophosphorylase; AltName: Full=Pantetheine-phosphate adenylyltransferase; Short=PPAT [Malacoplasma penetrans HF-2]BAC44751.1 putative lipopolysaccharide biosynthesis enzyme KdtB [Malacoplasma penetrans HF-2]
MSLNQKKKACIFPGTFEVFHDGHLNILKRALKLFDFVYIVVAINNTKTSSDLEKRYQKVEEKIDSLSIKNVEVIKWDSKISDFAKIKTIYFIIRGIRDVNDFKFEKYIADIYKQEWDKLEVVYFFSEKKLENISSRKIINLNKGKNDYEN